MTIGHENFNALCSFGTKRLCIVTGIPGAGKSEFTDEMCERLNSTYFCTTLSSVTRLLKFPAWSRGKKRVRW